MLPQEPQLLVLVWTSTQDEPHWARLPVQEPAQVPLEQVSPFWQALPQSPQLLGSDFKLTQVPLQVV
jgi:hypothetical protein